jgi:KUP system potassium uptake protein
VYAYELLARYLHGFGCWALYSSNDRAEALYSDLGIAAENIRISWTFAKTCLLPITLGRPPDHAGQSHLAGAIRFSK